MAFLRHQTRLAHQAHLTAFAKIKRDHVTGLESCRGPGIAALTAIKRQITMILAPDHSPVLCLITPKNNTVHVSPDLQYVL